MWQCPRCGEELEDREPVCSRCRTPRPDSAEPQPMPLPVGLPEPDEFAPDLLLTTAPSLEGFRIVETIDIVSAECVVGFGVISEIMAAFSDMLGGRNETAQNALRQARVACLSDLRREGYEAGGNAVIAVRLDYHELTGDGKSMLMLVATGTAVVVEPVDVTALDTGGHVH